MVLEDYCIGCSRPSHTHLCPKCRSVRYLYGVEPSEVVRLRQEQANRCATCNRPDELVPLRIDHDHKTGEIRGLLCNRCNTMLSEGMTSELLRSMADYLEKPNPILKYIPRQQQRGGSFNPKTKQFADPAETQRIRVALESVVGLEGSLRARARKLAEITGLNKDAALTRLHRYVKKQRKAQKLAATTDGVAQACNPQPIVVESSL